MDVENGIQVPARNVIWSRFGSGEASEGSVLDGESHGSCRWCGTKMQAEYPRDGHAFNTRCCSQVCQLLYGNHLGYWEATEKDGLPDLSELPEHVRNYNRMRESTIRVKPQTMPSWWLEDERKEKALLEKQEARAIKQAAVQDRRAQKDNKRTLKRKAGALGLGWQPKAFRSEKVFLKEMAKRVAIRESQTCPEA
jgi:hypothetical protein